MLIIFIFLYLFNYIGAGWINCASSESMILLRLSTVFLLAASAVGPFGFAGSGFFSK